jgi:hypothetical protein
MEKISWTYHVRNEEVLLRVKEQRNILHEIRKRKANSIGHILRRNCHLQRVTERKIQGEIEVTERQGRRRRKLLDDFKERKGYSHLKEEALDRTMWRACFGRGFGPVVRQTAKYMNFKIHKFGTLKFTNVLIRKLCDIEALQVQTRSRFYSVWKVYKIMSRSFLIPTDLNMCYLLRDSEDHKRQLSVTTNTQVSGL